MGILSSLLGPKQVTAEQWEQMDFGERCAADQDGSSRDVHRLQATAEGALSTAETHND